MQVTRHAKFVSVVKSPPAVLAVVLPMPHSIHMLLLSSPAAESSGTGIAIPTMMTVIIHVIVTSLLAIERRGACIAFVGWSPMIERVHMLFAGMIACKGSVATFTFKHGWLANDKCSQPREMLATWV